MDKEDVEDFSNDPLEAQEMHSPKTVKKGRERPKKGQEKKKLPKKNYNTRHHISVSEVVTTAVSVSSSKFQIDDSRLEASGMKTTFKSWAEECESENTTPPMHGDKQVI